MAGSVLVAGALGGPSSTDGARIAPEEKETSQHDFQGCRLHTVSSAKMGFAGSSIPADAPAEEQLTP